jgi:hypothetical protein
MYDLDLCLTCGLPFTPVELSHDIFGLGDEFTNWVAFVDDEVCQCAAEDDDD